MESNYRGYYLDKSLKRMDDILGRSDNEFEEKDFIPPRSSLTYKNGFYVNVSAIFVDMRDSSSLTDDYYRPTLAKIYRSFISEVVAVMNGNLYCEEINIVGDCVSGIFRTDNEEEKNDFVETLFKINGVISVLNCKLSKKDITTIRVGIGADYGRALMIKAGYSGSGIDEVVWMGDVVNNASKLSDKASYYFNKPILIGINLHDILPMEKRLIFDKHSYEDCFESDEIDSEMNNWIEENCDK